MNGEADGESISFSPSHLPQPLDNPISVKVQDLGKGLGLVAGYFSSLGDLHHTMIVRMLVCSI